MSGFPDHYSDPVKSSPGFLTGKYKTLEDFGPDNAFRAGLPRMQKANWDKNYKLVEEFEKIAKAKGCTPGQLSLAWLMAQPGQIIPIPGVRPFV